MATKVKSTNKSPLKSKAGKGKSRVVSIVRWTYRSIMAVLTCILCLLLLASAYSELIDPERWVQPSFLGIGFGILLAMALIWLVVIAVLHHWRCLLLQGVTLLLVAVPAWRYCPLNVPGGADPMLYEGLMIDSVQVLTYNTCAMGQTHLSQIKEKIPVIDLVRDSGADLVCLQEYAFTLKKGGHTETELRGELRDCYSYYDFTPNTGKVAMGIALYSKYPIRKAQRIDKRKKGYFSAMYYQLEREGRRFGLVNVHLRTNGIHPKDRLLYDEMLDHFVADSIGRLRTGLLHSLAKAFRLRAAEAKQISQFLQENHPADMPLLVCGDMNDTPVSYCHRTLRKGLTDTWQEVGFGPGISFHEHRFWFRIDHVLHSSHFRALDIEVLNQYAYSDHYPVMVTLQLLPPQTKTP